MSEAVSLGDERPSMGQCDNCGRDNKATARFCAGCGSSVTRSCASCGHELDADARFCEDCGSPVASASPAPSPDPIAPSEAVRKTVTVLFCDLVGSTAFAERVDAESARESMSRYHAMAKSAIEANGGTVAKFIGDGVMALFGVPEVAEDDAERAVAAGADLQRGFEPVRDHIGSRVTASRWGCASASTPARWSSTTPTPTWWVTCSTPPPAWRRRAHQVRCSSVRRPGASLAR